MTPPLKFELPEETLQALAAAVLPAVVEQLAPLLAQRDSGGYLNPEGAAAYLGVSRKRVYDLRSAGAIEPDGYDGRTPLFRRATLDAYAQGGLPTARSKGRIPR